jgi:hypothetical protein
MVDSSPSFRKIEPEEDSIEAFYEKYAERMCCFDNLNSQQTYALGQWLQGRIHLQTLMMFQCIIFVKIYVDR